MEKGTTNNATSNRNKLKHIRNQSKSKNQTNRNMENKKIIKKRAMQHHTETN